MRDSLSKEIVEWCESISLENNVKIFPAGTYLPDDEEVCLSCEGNTFSTEEAISCTPCETRTFANAEKTRCGTSLF
jgi:hypothetical protein